MLRAGKINIIKKQHRKGSYFRISSHHKFPKQDGKRIRRVNKIHGRNTFDRSGGEWKNRKARKIRAARTRDRSKIE